MPHRLTLILLLLACACGGVAPGPAGRDEARRLRPLGRQLAQELQSRLRSELMGALEAGGPAAAREFCAGRAAALAGEVGGRAKPSAALKRVARLARNPESRPDEWERLALEYFERELEMGRPLPEDWVQHLDRDGRRRLRYYQPILAGAPCLACHPVKERELLGLIRVEIDARDLPKPKASR